MKSIYVELLMGHSTGVSDSYMKPVYQDMVQEYSKAIPALTILSREEVTKDDMEKVRKEAALEAMPAVATSFGIDPIKIRIEKQKELVRELTGDEELEMIRVEMAKTDMPMEATNPTVRESSPKRS